MTAVARRERVRAATITEIKQTALALMHEQGTTNVRFTDIARAMGMTPPALYRYFADRDELLTVLITDGYNDLGEAVAAARGAVPAEDVAGQWVAGAQAYRQWAKREPQQFTLLFGLPVPGYAAPEDGSTTEAAQRAMGQLGAVFVAAREAGKLDPPQLAEASPAIRACAEEKAAQYGALPAESFQAMLHTWAAVHGFITLEANGHFDWLPVEARDELFLAHLRVTGDAAGLPVPE